MTPEQAADLAARTLAAIDAAAGWRNEKPHHAADRERVASDLAGLRAHKGKGAILCLACTTPTYADTGCPDARRYADGLRRTARLYGES